MLLLQFKHSLVTQLGFFIEFYHKLNIKTMNHSDQKKRQVIFASILSLSIIPAEMLNYNKEFCQYQHFLKRQMNTEGRQENQEHQFRQYPYRYLIVVIFSALAFVNGATWVVVTPIAIPLIHAYQQTAFIMSLIPMTFMIAYPVFSFPCNWIIDSLGLRPGMLFAAILLTLGAVIRCLVQVDFAYVIVGQCLCAISQLFIQNSTTKIAVRWFLPESRSVIISVLVSAVIIGHGIGFILPPLFVSSTVQHLVRSQFFTLVVFQFALSVIPLFMVLIWFDEHPPTPTSPASEIQHEHCCSQIFSIFKQIRYITLNVAFGIMMGIFTMLGSVVDQILGYYGYSSGQVGILSGVLQISGIFTATLSGFYIERTLKYNFTFRVLAVLGVLSGVAFPLIIGLMKTNFVAMLFLFIILGIVLVSCIPLSFGYSCDIMYPAGEAQVTGWILNTGNVVGILMIVVSQSLLGLGAAGNSFYQNKTASFNTVIMISALMILGSVIYFFHDSELKRSKMEVQAGENIPKIDYEYF